MGHGKSDDTADLRSINVDMIALFRQVPGVTEKRQRGDVYLVRAAK